jgi:oxygen-independent coproporphyrinogen III oxidase
MDDINVQTFLNNTKIDKFIVDYQLIFNKYNLNISNIKNIEIDNIFNFQDNQEINFYFNFPWCEKQCSFCNYSFGIEKDKELYEKSINSVVKNWNDYNFLFKKTKATSIFFGGGTPTIISEYLLDYYLESIISNSILAKTASITLESNINNLVPEKLIIAKKYVNRMSIGVQSFDTKVRKKANMIFNAKEIFRRLQLVRNHIDNINIDLIYGMLGQDENSFLKDIKMCIDEKISSITLYKLELHNNLTYCKNILSQVNNLDYDLKCANMFFEAQKMLETEGYIQQPTGWFVKNINNDKWSDRVKDWENSKPYVGFGNGAYSHVNNYYIAMTRDFNKWSDFVDNRLLPIEYLREKSIYEKEILKFIRIIRTNKEIEVYRIDYINEKINFKNKYCLYDYFEYLLKLSLVSNINNEKFVFTEEGISVINWIVLEICKLTFSEGIYDN